MINIVTSTIISSSMKKSTSAPNLHRTVSSKSTVSTNSASSTRSIPELFMNWIHGPTFTNPRNDNGYSALSSDEEEDEFREIHHEYLQKKHCEFSKRMNAITPTIIEDRGRVVKVNLGAPTVRKTR